VPLAKSPYYGFGNCRMAQTSSWSPKTFSKATSVANRSLPLRSSIAWKGRGRQGYPQRDRQRVASASKFGLNNRSLVQRLDGWLDNNHSTVISDREWQPRLASFCWICRITKASSTWNFRVYCLATIFTNPSARNKISFTDKRRMWLLRDQRAGSRGQTVPW
jgi:hypothetical protein